MKKIFLALILILFALGVGYAFVRTDVHQKFTANLSATPVPVEVIRRYILMGDTGSGAPEQFQVGAAIAKYCQAKGDCQAVFILGDVFYENGVKSVDDPYFTTRFLQPYKDVNLPFYIAYGNHDYLGCEECYIEYGKTSKKWHMPDEYYVQEFDQLVNFFVTDTEKFNKEQQQWLQENLAQSQTPWNIVVGHRPLQSDEISKHEESWSGEKQFQDIVCRDADLYVSGHAHILEKPNMPETCKAMHLISGGGGASLRETIPNPTSPYVHQGYGFLAVQVSRKRLDMEYVSKDGEILKTFEITHK